MSSNYGHHHDGKRVTAHTLWCCASVIVASATGCALTSDGAEPSVQIVEPTPAEEAHAPEGAKANEIFFTFADILWRHDDGTLAIWIMDGLTKTREAYPVWWDGNPPSTDWTFAATGDFDADHLPDILWRNTSGALAIWNIDSYGQLFDETYPSLHGAPVGAGWSIAGVGSFGRGFADDILWRKDTGEVAIWHMADGDLLIESYPDARTTDWNIEGIGDFDGDGTSDILWRRTDGRLDIWFMSTTGTVASTQTPGHPSNDWQVVAVRDFNRDGKADILWRSTDGTNAIWLMDGGVNTAQAYPGSLPTSWQVQGVGDFDRDNNPDILWRNTTGTLMIWFMHGTTLASGGSPGAPPLSWTVQDVVPFGF